MERQASENAKKLAALDLPPPSALTDQEAARLNSATLQRINSDIAKLQLSAPEALTEVEKKKLEDLQQELLNETISHMQLPNPEQVDHVPSAAPSEGSGNANKQKAIPVPVPGGSIAQTDQALLSEPTQAPAASSTGDDQVVTPWDVEGAIVDGKQVALDYNKLVDKFGTKRIDEAILERFEKLTGQKPHHLLRRGMFFSHR
jgi:tryptophanyl-tRNA synthetase